ncbi:uncharacterized protein LOC112085330 [Eutrema salsugineum]|uniref:uncharacterized protein LOC112085330 n=1 Tax=Eutrema salsugineum TaxID=72664 RepID=UPI000CED0FEC|nr:uncharacterized protein LOC112085330 [Eutrema salsugineum]
MPTKSTPPIRIQPKKSTHVRFAQVSSSEEETKSSESKEIAALIVMLVRRMSKDHVVGLEHDGEGNENEGTLDDHNDADEEVNLDGEGIGNEGQNDDQNDDDDVEGLEDGGNRVHDGDVNAPADQAKSLMDMGGSSALDQATIAHNQIASVLSDLAKDPYEAYTTVPSTAVNSGIPFMDQFFVEDDQIRDVNPSPAKSEKTLEDRAIVNEHLKAVEEPPIPAQTSSELPQQGKVTDVVKPVTNSEIPEGVEPPVWSLGLTQEEKNMVEANKIPSEEPQPVRKSKRVAQPSTTMSDYVVPRPKRSKKNDNLVDLSHFFAPPTPEQLTFLQTRMEESRVIRLFWHQLSEINDTHSKVDFVEYAFIHQIEELYPKFINPPKKKPVTLPTGALEYVKSRRSWYTQIGRIYCPYEVDCKYWVGLCIDFESHEIFVLNPYETFKEMKLKTSVSPLAQCLPHFIRKVAYNTEMKSDTLIPFTIKVVKPMFQTLNLGLLGLMTLMSLQLHSSNISLDMAIGDDVVRDAALKFAYDLLCLIEPSS